MVATRFSKRKKVVATETQRAAMTAFIEKNCRRMNKAGVYFGAMRPAAALRVTKCHNLKMGVG